MSPHSEIGLSGADTPPQLVESLPSLNGGPVNLNGFSTTPREPRLLQATDPSELHDLVCVGFGPASLAVAVALSDSIKSGKTLVPGQRQPKVLFLEKQAQFAWHAGMLLPGAKMQISFIKDMATLRDPTSHFTFLNYLHKAGRLVEFTNLSTFLPARVEYEDYLRWCASHFDNVVQYGREVVSVSPDRVSEGSVKTFTVRALNTKTGQVSAFRAKKVLVAIGGQPSIPKCLPQRHPQVIHSSQYAHLVPKLLKNHLGHYRVAVVGAGQSAAEIFSNVQRLYPNSKTWLVMRSEFLKPSDDSPFVNSIFNPEYVDALYPKSPRYRRNLIQDAKATNYGVVRLELIEELYERMYDQRREYGVDETAWPHRIMAGRAVTKLETGGRPGEDGLRLHVRHVEEFAEPGLTEGDGFVEHPGSDEVLDVDLVIAATGYQRNGHVTMLKDSWDLLPETSSAPSGKGPVDGWEVCDEKACAGSRKLQVGRDYRVRYAAGAVAPGSGVWLQGCCEATHGLSDTLLSVLATRSGEMIDSLFSS